MIYDLGSTWGEAAANCYDDAEQLDTETIPYAIAQFLEAYEASKNKPFSQIESAMHYFTIHPAEALQEGFDSSAFDVATPEERETLREALAWAKGWEAWEQENGLV